MPSILIVDDEPGVRSALSGVLRDEGYAHVESVVLDLFPQTHHVEVVTLFVPRPPASARKRLVGLR